jgi:hypothetical protein
VVPAAPMYAPILRESTELCQGRLTVPDVIQLARNGMVQIWLVTRGHNDYMGVIVTEVLQYPNRKVCGVIQCAGKGLHEAKHLMADLEQWARNIGCSLMEIQGRPGWGRVYPDYREDFRVFVKEL